MDHNTRLNGVAARDENLYLTAGGDLIFKTTDGGSTWIDRSSAESRSVEAQAVAFASSSVACVVGYGGIVRSTDAGDTWTRATLVPSGNPELYDVSFPVPGIGIAVGAGGVIFRTTDEGASWQRVQSGLPYELHGVAMGDAQNGIAVGTDYGGGADKGVVLRTTDGGATWTPSTTPSSVTLYDVQWITSTMQVMVGVAPPSGELTVFVTSDGGSTWETSGSLGGQAITCADAWNWVLLYRE